MNNDRIAEVYKGEIWSDEAQARARARINWICREAVGDRVLDVGTSQGIVPLLLGREGVNVVGVDVQADRIEYAQRELEKEAAETRERVDYVVGDGGALDFEDGAFDAVILGEILEHLLRPEHVLQEAIRVLRPGGRVVITTPFGLLDHHDHKQTFFPDDLLELLEDHLGVQRAEVSDRYFRIIGVKDKESAPGVAESLRASAYSFVRTLQKELVGTTVERNRLRTQLDKALSEHDRTAKRLAETLAALDESKARVSKVQERVVELEGMIATLEREVADRNSLSTHQSGDPAISSRYARELAAARREIEELKARRDLLGHRAAVARWKLASMRQRRWWRLGALLGQLKRRPWSIVSVITDFVRLLRARPEKLPRPSPPSTLRAANQSGVPIDGAAHPIAPRQNKAGVGVVTDALEVLLQHQMLFKRLPREGWTEVLNAFAPQTVVLQQEEAANWSPEELRRLREASEELGAELISVGASGAGATIHRRMHNPIGGHSRKRGHAVVDPARRIIDGVSFETEAEFVEAVKQRRVAVVDGSVEASDLARLAATSTALVLEDPELAAFGIVADNEEAREVAIRALTRSDVFAARTAHGAMRAAYRNHDVGELVADPGVGTPPVDVMIATMRPDRLEDLLDNVGRQTYPEVRLHLTTHGITLDESHVRDLAEERGVRLAGVWTEPEDVVAGEVFNRGFARTEAALVAKMDDDDFYGAEYLWDLVHAKDASGAEVAGKWAHYAYLEGPNQTVYRFRRSEHRFTDLVAISTLLMDRTVLDDERFPAMPYGSGSVFLRAIGAAGARVYAADRWNYLYRRSAEGEGNTFPVSDLTMLAKSQVVCSGLTLDEVIA